MFSRMFSRHKKPEHFCPGLPKVIFLNVLCNWLIYQDTSINILFIPINECANLIDSCLLSS